MRTSVRPPGDKSISHRLLMLAPLAEGESRIRGLLASRDVRSTAAAMRAVGAEIRWEPPGEARIPGPAEIRDASERIDCGNSGTTARILVGLLAGLGVAARLDGDASLRARPMDRVVYPLQALGAGIEYLGARDRLPIELQARATGSLRTLRHRPKVASAQVKSSLLLAGLTSGTHVEVVEPGRSRDHTERLLDAMGAEVTWGPVEDGWRAAVEGGEGSPDLEAVDVRVPGDPSSAAFLVAAGLLGRREVRIEGMALNPTRTGFVEVLLRAGARIETEEEETVAGEPVGTLTVEPSELDALEVGPGEVPRTLDEIPVLAVLAVRCRGTSVIRGAEELRVKESDRLSLLAENLRRLDVECREREDGLEIRGTTAGLAGRVETGGDHRIAMAFGVLGSSAGVELEMDDPTCVDVSYPGFWEDLASVAGEEGVPSFRGTA